MLRALIDNAIKYSPAGSSVRLSSALEEAEAVVVVADDGPGISGKELPHVFERFHRGREERGTTTGAGLGLSIARELTEMMGGSITAESPAGRRRALHGAPAARRPAGAAGARPDDPARRRSQALTASARLLNTPVGDR